VIRLSKKTIIISSVVICISLVIGLSFAYFSWRSDVDEKTDVRVVVEGLDITYNGGDDITNAKLNPTLTKNEGIEKKLTISLANTLNNSVCADFKLELTTLPTELQYESFRYEFYKGSELLNEGGMNDKNEGDIITLAEKQTVTDVVDEYTLYLWINGNMETPNVMMNKSFSFKISALASDNGCDVEVIPTEFYVDASGARVPDLIEGMVPITWDSNNNIVKADYYNINSEYAGYDYSSNKYANVVMVAESSREEYLNASAGTTINESDILAYYVWIPRYRYQLFNTEFNTAVYTFPDLETMGECSANCEQTIFIEYEKLDDEKVQGTQNGQMLTHPAFTFGETELNGLWVAKFEPSADVNSLCYTEISLDNCNNTNQDLRILPGVSSLRYQYLSTQYFSGQKFASTTYLTETGVNEADSHIAKNIEWGAIAYLSNSSYGKNSEIAINNVSGYFTGGGEGKAYLTNTEQSSNGNITGIYDISGGCFESVMGNYNNTAGNSGLDMTTLGDYVDIYDVLDASGSILGDAIGETGIWYSDYNVALNASSPWYIRGGYRTSGVYAGAFAYNRANGQYSTYRTFRPIMIAK